MKKIILLTIILFGPPVFAAEQSRPKPFPEQYQKLITKNIFSRNRQSQRQINIRRQRNQGRRISQPTDLNLYILRGCVIENHKKFAFVEDTVSETSLRCEVGAELARGVIRQINQDHIVFESGEETKNIKIGEMIIRTQQMVEVEVSSEEPTETTETKTTTTPPASSGNDDDIIKQMMERRSKELK